MVSGLPITYGNPAVGLFLWSHPSDISIDPFTNASPLGGPIFGKCDGYGGITSSDDEYDNWFLTEFNSAFAGGLFRAPGYGTQKQLITSIGELLTTAYRNDEFGIMDQVIEGSLRPCNILHCLMHRWAWDYVVSVAKKKRDYNKETEAEVALALQLFGSMRTGSTPSNPEMEQLAAWWLSPRYSEPHKWNMRFSMQSAMVNQIPEVPYLSRPHIIEKFYDFYAFVYGLYLCEINFETTRSCGQTHDRKAITGLYEESLKHAKLKNFS